jgi:ArsR family transcriptional regulator, cadmium/lead-responsive transcriptional repressor
MSVASQSPFRISESPTEGQLVAKYFRGLGDATRLAILELLADGAELSAGEIVTAIGLPQATVSTHLGCLRWCGFVVTRRAQRSVLYRIADERVLSLMRLGHQLLRDNAEHVAACRTIDKQP